MASNITRDVLRSNVRNKGEFDSTTYFPDAMLNTWINDSIAALYDELVKADPERFTSTSDINVLSGTKQYALPADFYKLLDVELKDTSSETGYRPMARINRREINRYGADAGNKYDTKYIWTNTKIELVPQPGWTETGGVRIVYIPTAPSLSDDVTAWDTVNLWSEWVVDDVCEKCAVREESMTQARYFAQQRDRTWQRITQSAEGDNAGPKTITNVNRYARLRRWYPT